MGEVTLEGERGVWPTEGLFVHLFVRKDKSVFMDGWELMCGRREGRIAEAGLSEAHLAFQSFPQG